LEAITRWNISTCCPLRCAGPEDALQLRTPPTILAGEKNAQPKWIHAVYSLRLGVRTGMAKGLMVPQDMEIDTDNERFAGRLKLNSSVSSCGRLAQLLQSRESVLNVDGNSDSAQVEIDVVPCGHCGSPARVGHGYCLSCILHQGLEYDSENAAHWDDVLEEVNVRGSEWRIGNYQILQEIGRGGM